jgi:predicted PurR-regulated permease PerM
VKIFILALCILLAIKILFDYDSLAGGIGRVMGIFAPFIAGFLIAFCVNLPVAWLEDKLRRVKAKRLGWVRKFSRGFSIMITMIVLITVFVFGLSRLIPMIYNNMMQLTRILPDMMEQTLNAVKGLPFAADLGIDKWADSMLADNPFSMVELNVAESISLAQGLFSGVFAVFLAFVSAVYFILEYNSVKAFLERLIMAISNEKKRNATMKYVKLVNRSFRKFLGCQLLDSLILGTITTIVFLILRSPYALTLGMLLGVLNIIPYFGSIFGSAVAVFITAFTNGWETALLTALILLIIQQIDGNFINPKIMGKSFKLSPVLVIIGITVGGAIGGVPGMIFAIPVVNVLKTVLVEFIESREAQAEEEKKPAIKGTTK